MQSEYKTKYLHPAYRKYPFALKFANYASCLLLKIIIINFCKGITCENLYPRKVPKEDNSQNLILCLFSACSACKNCGRVLILYDCGRQTAPG